MDRTLLKHSIYKIIAFLLAIAFCAYIHGAIPFLAVPSIGQAFWISGFAESYVNAGWPSIYAANAGYPLPAPIAYGLSGTFLQSVFIALFDMPAGPAYALMVLCYLILALWGAMKFAQALGLHYFMALLAALGWMSGAIIWAHNGYTMLSLGIALLPFYLWITYLLCKVDATNRAAVLRQATLFIATAVLAVFMDGYSYMMFVVGSGILLAYQWFLQRKNINRQCIIPTAIFSIGVLCSYLLYRCFIRFSSFIDMPLDFFRGWGADISMFFIPTKGFYWIWDMFSLNIARSHERYFGDSSVWITTFSAIYILFAVFGFFWMRKQKPRLVYPLLLITLFGFYMSLGPSIKIFSLRPLHDVQAHNLDSMMPSEYALAPTGSGILSEHFPGFKDMRASYRWTALGLVGAWGLFVLFLIGLQEKNKTKWAVLFAIILIIGNIPSPAFLSGHFAQSKKWRNLDENFGAPLYRQIKPGSLVAFMPPGNDFLVNYLAAVGKFKAYNTGGDKNIYMLRKKWPTTFFSSYEDNITKKNYRVLCMDVKHLLNEGKAEKVIVPFMDLNRYAHVWPPEESYIQEMKNKYQPQLDCLRKKENFDVVYEKYFAVITPAFEQSPATN